MKLSAVLVVLLPLSLASFAGCLMPPQSGGGSTYGGGPSSPSSSGGSEPGFASTSSPAATPAAAPAAAPAGPVSVTIRSACSKTVKVFYGDKPKFGSGTYSSIDSNSVQSHSFRPGEMLWIVDESQNGLGSATIGASTRELEISSSCTAIAAR